MMIERIPPAILARIKKLKPPSNVPVTVPLDLLPWYLAYHSCKAVDCNWNGIMTVKRIEEDERNVDDKS